MTSLAQAFFKELSWEELSKLAPKEDDQIEGPTNPYALIRLFGSSEKNIRVTLFRDHHAWCPYCQKVWLWLEWKRIPYKIKKVTMYCYGKKEEWYLNKVPSGMLPAIEIDNKLYTESDHIIYKLEEEFGPLGLSFLDPQILELRHLERKLFRSWCIWLCQPCLLKQQEFNRRDQFKSIAREMEDYIKKNKSYLMNTSMDQDGNLIPGSGDIVFIPYVERMNASLAYYKGFNLREEHPYINEWLKVLELSSTYRGTQGDFHTHAHDLPPQMGGCFLSVNEKQKEFTHAVDTGYGLGDIETSFNDPKLTSNKQQEAIALMRVLRHKKIIKQINILEDEKFDQPLRAALTRLITGKSCKPNKGSAKGLRYLRDRISVPRDMPLLSARKFRKALEETAILDNKDQGPTIPIKNRLDQDPQPFLIQSNIITSS